jgi:hypothetical protein
MDVLERIKTVMGYQQELENAVSSQDYPRAIQVCLQCRDQVHLLSPAYLRSD